MPTPLMYKCCNNIDSFYEYENGKTNINGKGRLKNSVQLLGKELEHLILSQMLSMKSIKFLYYMNQNQYF